MADQDKFSLIIPTHNRPKFLHRLLSYYAKHKMKTDILVSDSSLEEEKKINEKITQLFPELNIKYFNDFSSDISFYQKLANTFDCIDTKYSVICADDDFITPKAITKSIDYLEKNPDFTAVGGYYLNFLKKVSKEIEDKFFWKRYLSNSPDIDSYMTVTPSNPESRFTLHFLNYFPTIYYVQPTNFQKMIYKETITYTNTPQFGELLGGMLTAIYGKIKTLSIF